ncbi:MAG: hypothetical protein KH009_04040 [Clostridiales bacterium]|nr:hypothetical protein [Clostridiales bacterium]
MKKLFQFVLFILTLSLLSGCTQNDTVDTQPELSSSEDMHIESSVSQSEPEIPDEESSAISSSKPVDGELQNTVQFQILDPMGDPSPNIGMLIFAVDGEGNTTLVDAAQSDADGYTRNISDLPYTDLKIVLDNRSIPYEDERREKVVFVTNEERLSSSGAITLVWDAESYRSASENCLVKMKILVLDSQNNPIRNANVDFYCSFTPYIDAEGNEKQLESSPKLTAGGWTDADGIYLYAFPSHKTPDARDGFVYTITVEHNGISQTKDLTMNGAISTVTFIME